MSLVSLEILCILHSGVIKNPIYVLLGDQQRIYSAGRSVYNILSVA